MTRRAAIASWTLAAMVALSAGGGEGHAGTPRSQADYVPASEIDPARREEVESVVADAIRSTLAVGSRQHLLRSVRIGVCDNLAIVDLSADFLPKGLQHLSGELEDQLHMITTTVIWTVESEFGLVLYGSLYTFDGKALPHYYPGDYRPEDADALACEEEG